MVEEDGVDLFGLLDLTTPWCVHVAATLRSQQPSEAVFQASESPAGDPH